MWVRFWRMFSPPQHFTHLGRIWHAYLVAKANVKHTARRSYKYNYSLDRYTANFFLIAEYPRKCKCMIMNI